MNKISIVKRNSKKNYFKYNRIDINDIIIN